MSLQSYSSPLEKYTLSLQVFLEVPRNCSHVIRNKSICIMRCCSCSGLSSSTYVSTITCHHSLYLLVIHHLPLSIHHPPLGIHHLPLGIHHHLLGICWVPPCLLGIHNLPPGIVVSADALPFHHHENAAYLSWVLLPGAAKHTNPQDTTWYCSCFRLYCTQCSLRKLGKYPSIIVECFVIQTWKKQSLSLPPSQNLSVKQLSWFFCLFWVFWGGSFFNLLLSPQG